MSFPAFSRAARGDLTLSFPRRFASFWQIRERDPTSRPRHHSAICVGKREKKRGRLSSSTRKKDDPARSRDDVPPTKGSQNAREVVVVHTNGDGSPRFQNSTNEFRDEFRGRDDKNREKKKRRRRRKLSRRRTRSPVFLRDEHPLVLAVSVPLEHVREILDGFLRCLVEAQAAVRVRIDRRLRGPVGRHRHVVALRAKSNTHQTTLFRVALLSPLVFVWRVKVVTTRRREFCVFFAFFCVFLCATFSLFVCLFV